MHRYCSTSNQLCAALHICWLYCNLLTYALARRQEMKWGVFFVKKGPFPTKWNETGSNVACFVSYDSNQLFTIYDLQSWNANVTFSHNKCGKITVKHWELDLFFILHFTYLGGAYAPNAPSPCLQAWCIGCWIGKYLYGSCSIVLMIMLQRTCKPGHRNCCSQTSICTGKIRHM